MTKTHGKQNSPFDAAAARQLRLGAVLIGITLGSFAIVVRADDGRDNYLENCASCHGEDGKAKTPAGKKSRAKDLTVSKLTDADIERQIVNGGPKDSKGRQAMPPFKDTLTPEQIAAVATYVKTLRP
ncbi:MAG TPA: c-type cytochrome [Candidatus Didemnitutus sp.]|nr:c-type cytochrome [Candidatus Didemnitutus sp.]